MLDAIIVDIDGTLAKHNRSPYDYDSLLTDDLHEHVALLVNSMYDLGYMVIIVSGRPEAKKGKNYREMTETWLFDKGVKYHRLFMRGEGDNRKDDIIKYEIYVNYISGMYKVHFVLDDRNRVVDMWRDVLNIPCFQVAPGDF